LLTKCAFVAGKLINHVLIFDFYFTHLLSSIYKIQKIFEREEVVLKRINGPEQPSHCREDNWVMPLPSRNPGLARERVTSRGRPNIKICLHFQKVSNTVF
jgi:hypothetical protein